ncbi:MAG: PhoH family protein [Candidatus Alcyoniella australis]|nr:PhoH family protein [Candidatus Alcyoniella australis]
MSADESDRRKKAYFLDTSVIAHDSHCLHAFEDNYVVIPLVVIDELDKLKSTRDDAVAYNAREAIRILEALSETGNMIQGIDLPNGGKIFLANEASDWTQLNGEGLGLKHTPDNAILRYVCYWRDRHPDQRPILVSKDTNMRLKGRGLDFEVQNYLYDRLLTPEELSKLDAGHTLIEVNDPGVFQAFCQALIRTDRKATQPPNAALLGDAVEPDSLAENQCCTIRHDQQYVLAIYKRRRDLFINVPKPDMTSCAGDVKPKNDAQAFAYSLALDPEIKLLALDGKAGSGKTLIALLAGYNQLGDGYDQMRVYRPTTEIGDKLGFLPGDIEEKFGPWKDPIIDNLRFMLRDGGRLKSGFKDGEQIKGDLVAELMAQQQIIIQPITFLRGRSIPFSYIIVDEAQNLTPVQIKTVITRAGRGTKVVMVGDPSQIDNRYLDSVTNGLVYAIHRCRKTGWPHFGHVQLETSERSELADFAAEAL